MTSPGGNEASHLRNARTESVETLSRNSDLKLTQNLQVCTICFRPEVLCEVITTRNVKSREHNLVVNVEGRSSNSLRDIKKNHYSTAADIDDSIARKRLRVSLNKWNVNIWSNTIGKWKEKNLCDRWALNDNYWFAALQELRSIPPGCSREAHNWLYVKRRRNAMLLNW